MHKQMVTVRTILLPSTFRFRICRVAWETRPWNKRMTKIKIPLMDSNTPIPRAIKLQPRMATWPGRWTEYHTLWKAPISSAARQASQFPMSPTRTGTQQAKPSVPATGPSPPIPVTGTQLAKAIRVAMAAQGKVVTEEYSAHLRSLPDNIS